MEQGIRIRKYGANLKVRDFEASRAFYDALGFQPIVEFGPNSESKQKFRGVIYGIGDSILEIAEGHIAVKPEVFTRQLMDSKISLMVYVDSLIPLLDACEKNKIKIAVKPRKFPWGQIGLVVIDPDGLVLVFLSEYSDDEARDVQARFDVSILRDQPDYSDEHAASIRMRSKVG